MNRKHLRQKSVYLCHLICRSFALLTAGAALLIISMASFAQNAPVSPKAMVITDPANKQKIRGQVNLAMVWGVQLKPPRQYSQAFINLKESMNAWTDIYVTLENHLRIDSERLISMPLIIIITTDDSFALTPRELENLKQYCENGGFIVFDNARPSTRTSYTRTSFEKMIGDMFGKETRLKPIPKNHDIFHCFFDFEDGPPPVVYQQTAYPGHLEGIWHNDRLVIVYSDMGYSSKWHDTTGNTLPLKLGVNFIVYGLTRPDGPAAMQ